jgi:hypothetical protein
MGLSEMQMWREMPDDQKDVVLTTAKKLIIGTKGWAGKLIDPEDTPRELSVFAREDRANGKYLRHLDEQVLVALHHLKKDVQRPLTPLYVAVWMMAMELPKEELTQARERAVTMLMRRVLLTALCVHEFNKDTGNWHLQQELKERGFFG